VIHHVDLEIRQSVYYKRLFNAHFSSRRAVLIDSGSTGFYNGNKKTSLILCLP